MNSSQLIIGICGTSQAGKSQLAKDLHQALVARNIATELIEIDLYIVEENLIPKIQDRIDWEDPTSIDWPKILDAIDQSTAEVIIVEGIFAFQPQLASLYTTKVLLKVDYDTYFKRRRLETRWGEEPEWYLEHVWNSNLILADQAKADIVLDGLDTNNVQKVLDQLPLKNH